MRLTTQFRNRALECLKRAEGSPTLELRVYWTEMAQLWHGLATHLEEARGYPKSDAVSDAVFAPIDPPATDEQGKAHPY